VKCTTGDVFRMIELEGGLDGSGLTVGIVAARFNEDVTVRLLDGALSALGEHGVPENRIALAWVPGSFEIPLAAKKMAETGQFNAIVCLGCVIKKETAHFEYVSDQAATGIGAAGGGTGVPLTFGVLTTYTHQQALERSGGDQGNKGYDAAVAAIRMANLVCRFNEIPGQGMIPNTPWPP
jgi:6,7-dimethyl-8-ribityllumazine synthase